MFTQRNITYRNEEITFTLIKNDNTADYIFKDWFKYSNVINKLITSKNTVIQAGGNCGLYPYLYSKDFDKVFTFEPDPKNFYCLTNNCKNNKIVKFNTAIGNSHQFLKMVIINQTNLGMNRITNTLSNDGDKGYYVYTITIDSLKIPDVSLIHYDIEGYEYEALLGSIKTIKKYHPLIILEISRMREEIFDFLKKLGYNAINEKDFNVVFVHESNPKLS